MAKQPGLYANIHAKRKRIAAGSGEKMRKPGTKGAPTAKSSTMPYARLLSLPMHALGLPSCNRIWRRNNGLQHASAKRWKTRADVPLP